MRRIDRCTGRASSRPTRRRLVGFTIIELVLVIALIAVVSAVAVPRFASAVTRQQVDVAAERLVRDLQLARREAMLRGTTCVVRFSTAADSYQLTGVPDPDHPAQLYRVNLARDPFCVDLHAVDFAGGTDLSFDPFGRPSTGGTLILRDMGGSNDITITVDATTGEARR